MYRSALLSSLSDFRTNYIYRCQTSRVRVKCNRIDDDKRNFLFQCYIKHFLKISKRSFYYVGTRMRLRDEHFKTTSSGLKLC